MTVFRRAQYYTHKISENYYWRGWSPPSYGVIVKRNDRSNLPGNQYTWINISEDVYADECQVSALLMSLPPCDGVLTVAFNLKHYMELDIYNILSGSSGAYYTKDKMRLGVRGEVYNNSNKSPGSNSTDWNNRVLYDGSFPNIDYSMEYMIYPIFLNDNILTVSVTPNDGYKLTTIKLTDDPNGSFDNAPETNTIQIRKPSKDLDIQLRGLVVLEPTSDEAIEEYNTVINSLTSESNT